MIDPGKKPFACDNLAVERKRENGPCNFVQFLFFSLSLFKLGLSDESEEEEEESEGGDGSRWEEKRRNQGSNFTH